MGGYEAVIDLTGDDPGLSPLGRKVAAPHSVIFEEYDLYKVETVGSEAITTFLEQVAELGCFFIRNTPACL